METKLDPCKACGNPPDTARYMPSGYGCFKCHGNQIWSVEEWNINNPLPPTESQSAGEKCANPYCEDGTVSDGDRDVPCGICNAPNDAGLVRAESAIDEEVESISEMLWDVYLVSKQEGRKIARWHLEQIHMLLMEREAFYTGLRKEFTKGEFSGDILQDFGAFIDHHKLTEQMLTEKNITANIFMNQVKKLHIELASLREAVRVKDEALQFYASENSYRYGLDIIVADSGARACKALDHQIAQEGE